MAEVADQACHVSGPWVDEDVDSGPDREAQMDPGHGYDDGADGAQTSPGLRIEPLKGLREPSIALALNRAHEVLGSFRIGMLDLLDRPIEVSEDPAHLFLDQAEDRGLESVDRRLRRLSKSVRRQTIGGLDCLAEDWNIGRRDELGFLRGGIRFPGGSRRRRCDHPVELLTLLIGFERHPEGELEEDGGLQVSHLSTDLGLRAQAGL
jgi:hypothetical protein